MSDETVFSKDLLFDDIASDHEKEKENENKDIFSEPFYETQPVKQTFKGDILFNEDEPQRPAGAKGAANETSKPKKTAKKDAKDDGESDVIFAKGAKASAHTEDTAKSATSASVKGAAKSQKTAAPTKGAAKGTKASASAKPAKTAAVAKNTAKSAKTSATAKGTAKGAKTSASAKGTAKGAKSASATPKKAAPKKSIEVKLAEGKALTKSEQLAAGPKPKMRSGAVLTEPPELPSFFEKDANGRDILPDIFYYKLRLTSNEVKYLYSRVKNILLSYRGMKGVWKNDCEEFKFGKETVARIALFESGKGAGVELYLALDPDEAAKDIFKHEKAAGKYAEKTPLKVPVKSYAAVKRAADLIELMNTHLDNELLSSYIPTAFAEALPFIGNSVLAGKENEPPAEGFGTGASYRDITDELSQAVIQKATGRSKAALEKTQGSGRLKKQRETGKKIKKTVAETQPIVYFYDACVGYKGAVEFVNIQQVLHDRFIGKMLPQQYFAVAEGSDRIEFLNFLSLKRAVEDCNANPDLKFVLNVSCRLLIYARTLERLIGESKTENGNLILSFDCALLEALGTVGIAAISQLKSAGVMIMIDNAESTTMRVLTEYEFDYLRLDARWYNENNAKKTAHLDMMVGYCNVQGITMTAMYVSTPRFGQFFVKHGITAVQGMAVSRPMRLIRLMVNSVRPL